MMTRQKNPAYKSSKEGWILRFLVLGNILSAYDIKSISNIITLSENIQVVGR